APEASLLREVHLGCATLAELFEDVVPLELHVGIVVVGVSRVQIAVLRIWGRLPAKTRDLPGPRAAGGGQGPPRWLSLRRPNRMSYTLFERIDDDRKATTAGTHRALPLEE